MVSRVCEAVGVGAEAFERRLVDAVAGPAHGPLQRPVRLGLEAAAPAGVEVLADAGESIRCELAVEVLVQCIERLGARPGIVGGTVDHGCATGPGRHMFRWTRVPGTTCHRLRFLAREPT